MNNLNCFLGDINLHCRNSDYDILQPENVPERGSLYAWKNDVAYAKIVMKSGNSKFQSIKITPSDFADESGNIIDKSNIETYFMRETKAFVGNGNIDDGSRESFPDVLEEAVETSMDENSILSVFIEIAVPKETASGAYKGDIVITADCETESFSFNLAVSEHILPDPENFKFDAEYWQYPYTVAQYYGWEPFCPEHCAFLKKHLEIYKKCGGHAITVSIVEEPWNGQTYGEFPSMIKWIKGKDKKFKFDFTDFDKWVTLCREMGLGDKIICYSMIPWGFKIKYTKEKNGKTKSTSPKPGTRKYNKVWGQFLKTFVSHCEEKGWFDNIYIGIDERPRVMMKAAYDLIDSYPSSDGKILKRAAAMNHFGENYFSIINRINDVSVGSTAARDAMDDYDRLTTIRAADPRGLKTTVYTCTNKCPNSFTYSQPGESYWTPLFCLAHGSTGYLRWAYDAWVKAPLEDTTHTAFESGDCFLIYPDLKKSIRLEMLTMGIRDVNKLIILSESNSEEVKSILSEIKSDYEHNKHMVMNEKAVKDLQADMHKAREKINNLSSQS